MVSTLYAMRMVPRGIAATSLVLLLMAGGVGAVFANTPASERLRDFLARTTTLTADFEQTLFDEQGQRLESGSGRVFLERPRRFRWEYLEPYPQLIVTEGGRVWFYDPELAQVIVKTWEGMADDTPAALLAMNRPLEEVFVIRDLAPGEHAPGQGALNRGHLDWVRLSPKSEKAPFVNITMGFEGKILAVMVLTDHLGQRTHLEFTGIEVNEKLAPRYFTFTPPDGVEVVESTE